MRLNIGIVAPGTKSCAELCAVLDRCFLKVGFRVREGSSVVLLHGEPENGLEHAEWPVLSLPEGVDGAGVSYWLHGKVEDLGCRVNWWWLGSQWKLLLTVGLHRAVSYDEVDWDLASRMIEVTKGLHGELGALETDGVFEGSPEESWFELRGESVGSIPKIGLDECDREECLGSGHLGKWLRSGSVPIREEGQSFVLTWKGGAERAIVCNCLVCGCVVPGMLGRGEEGTWDEGRREDADRLRRLAWQSEGIDGLRRKLGEPSYSLGGVTVDARERRSSGLENVRDQAVYWELLEKHVVVFREYMSGRTVVNFARKVA